MTGYVDHALATTPHYCRPPKLLEFGPPREPGGVPTIRRPHPEGSRFHCDGCGRVQVVWWRPTQRGPSVVICGGLEWRPETRRERRQRLGLRWWQRG